MLEASTIKSVLGLVAFIAGGTVAIESRYAHTETLEVVAAQTQYSIDMQIDRLTLQLGRLQAIKNPSEGTKREIRNLEKEIEQLKKIRNLK